MQNTLKTPPKTIITNKQIWPTYRIQKSTHKNQSFLYTNNEQSEKD